MKNKDNYEKYMDQINGKDMFNRLNVPIPDHEETLDEILAEGERLIQAELKLKSPKTKKTVKTKSNLTSENSNNPYIKARMQLFSKMDPAKKHWIDQVERGELKKDRCYDDFVKEVAILGDALSP
jgi:hypothetical protein